ncbi:MAG: YlbF family regulator [Gracilibacteraceae bacterium]|jgi:cell fate (sporulation/competence/biofilm development) regulator YlbF (YheA/YmcA/DUF963 family)|nr:YlbF family regulator [Gracilibacteraceae bacterium]
MDAVIYNKASDLAAAIADSKEGIRFREAESAVKNDGVARNLAQRWHRVYHRVNEVLAAGDELPEADARAVEFIEAKVENHPLMLEYIDAHKAFSELLSNVDGVLSAAFNFGMDVAEDTVCGGDPAQDAKAAGGGPKEGANGEAPPAEGAN